MTVLHTTFVKTRDGRIYDLGLREYPPRHDDCGCAKCAIVNAWTGPRSEGAPK